MRDASLRRRLAQIIERVEAAETIGELPDATKMSGYDFFYRIQLGGYRIGVYVEEDTVEFVRFLHRRDIVAAFHEVV